MKRKEPLSFLTKAEDEVMQIIWKLEKCLVRDILSELGDPDLPHSTVSSVVRILEKKGFVAHKAYGKTYEYYPVVSREEYMAQDVQSLLGKYFGGSAVRLVSFLAQKENLDLKELKELTHSLKKSKNKKDD